jgi:hypothetical protein
MQPSAFLEQSKDKTMSQNVTLPGMISAAQPRRSAIEVLASNEANSGQWMEADRVKNSRFPARSALITRSEWLCTAVDSRSKKILKTAISATLGHARRGYQVPKLDSQVIRCEANRTCHGCSGALGIPRGYRCTETATPISAPCSRSQSEIPYPNELAAKPSKIIRAGLTSWLS